MRQRSHFFSAGFLGSREWRPKQATRICFSAYLNSAKGAFVILRRQFADGRSLHRFFFACHDLLQQHGLQQNHEDGPRFFLRKSSACTHEVGISDPLRIGFQIRLLKSGEDERFT